MSEPRAGELPHSLHPASWLFGIAGLLKQLLLPLLALLILKEKDAQWVLWAMPAMLALTAHSVLRARAFRYAVTGSELLLREGVLDRSLRHIPLARIQNVSQRQTFLHRLFGVTELRLESAAGGKPEAVMKVLSLAAAAQLEALLRGDAPAGGTAADESGPELLFAMPLREVLLLGLSSNRGKLMVAALFGAVMPSQTLRPVLMQWLQVPIAQLTQLFSADLQAQAWLHLTALSLVLLLTGLLLLQLFSAAMALVKFHGFRLERQGERLLSSSGLSTKMRAAVRLPRLQRWELSSSWLQRRMGRCQLSVTVAGVSHGKEGDEKQSNFKELAPLASEPQAQALLKLCLPGLDWQSLAWRPLAAAGTRRRLTAWLPWLLLLWLALLAGRFALLELLGRTLPGGLLLVAGGLPPLALLLYARAWHGFAAYALTDEVIVYRSGVFTRRWVIVSLAKLQGLRLFSTALDRRHGLLRLQADTQGGSAMTRALDIPYLERAQAHELRSFLWRGLSR